MSRWNHQVAEAENQLELGSCSGAPWFINVKVLGPKKVKNLLGGGVAAKNPRGVELLFGITPQSMEEVKNVQGLEKMEIQDALLSVMTF